MTSRLYRYVGPDDLLAAENYKSARYRITRDTDIIDWLNENNTKEATATFIVDEFRCLWIAHQRSEHVACARGKEVLAAGEITFRRKGDEVAVVAITNQSTGYCPEPECWQSVVPVLHALDIEFPPEFSIPFIFRRCSACGQRNIVKDDWFECGVCQQPLSQSWNFDSS